MPKDEAQEARLARIPDWVILLAFCALFSLQVILSVAQKSATFDEPVNLASGYVALRSGDYRMMPQNLPVVKLLAAAPLLFLNVTMPALPQQWIDKSRYEFANSFLYEVNDADTLLMLGRLGVLPLSLLLGCCVYLWTKQLFGKAAALFALFLYSFEPNILAHSGLVTTDLAVTCWMFLVICGLYQVAGQVSLARLFLASLAFSLAFLTKFSTIALMLLVPVLGLVASLSAQPVVLRIKGLPQRRVTGPWGKMIIVVGVSVLMGLTAYTIIWAAYGFRFEGAVAPGYSYPKPWSETLPTQPLLKSSLLWAREARILPEPYLYGFSYLLGKAGKFVAFLNGEIRTGGWWYYFLVTFLLKTPVALLLLVLLAGWVQGRAWREAPVRTAFLWGPVLAYFGIISASGWNIGHRHLLPIYPFLCVLVGGLLPWIRRQRGLVKGAVAVLAAWYLAASLAIFPHYLAYFNELVGGPGNGYQYLVDSNLDWGQDLKGLKRYMDAHGIDRVWLSYFGTASPEYYGIVYNYLPSYTIFSPKDEKVSTPFVAISATNLQGVSFWGLGLDPDFFKDFRERTPIAKIGYSIFLYRLE